MARFAGKIGFARTVESKDEPGVWKDEIIERTYRGDINRRTFRNKSTNGINDNLTPTDVSSSKKSPTDSVISFCLWLRV